MGVGSQRHAPAALPPKKTRYPLYKRLGGLQGRSGQVQKISPPSGFNPRTAQPVASLYRLSHLGPSVQATKTQKGTEMKPHSFSTMSLDGGECSTSRPGRFTRGKGPQYHLYSRLGGHRGLSGLFGEEINSRAPIGV